MTDEQHRILIIGQKAEGISSFIKKNIKDAVIDSHSADDSLDILVNDPHFYDLIIITAHVKAEDKIKFIHTVQSCSDLRFLTIAVEVENLNSSELDVYIKAGARYCFDQDDPEFELLVIKKALLDSDKIKSIPTDLNIMDTVTDASFTFKTLEEAKALGNFIASGCPNPKLARLGIIELFINAVEHGNLEIDYHEKTKIYDKNNWEKHIKEKLNLPENKDKVVTVHYTKSPNEIKLRIEDQGKGFEWKKFQELSDSRKLDIHGRGVFLATSLSFSTLEYEGKGNIVNAKIKM